MGFLTRDQIQSASDVGRRVEVECPEWGGSVFVREISALERDRWEKQLVKRKGRRVEVDLTGGSVRARFAALVVVDPEGKPLFTASDVPMLSTKSARVLDRIWEAGHKLNGMGAEDDDEDKDAEKN
ncbi:MAG: hypothetical protein ACRC1K_12745 [Planctomycetia bacterium]